MTDAEKDAIMSWAMDEISEEEMLSRISADPHDPPSLSGLLRDSLDSRDPDEVECVLMLGFEYGFGESGPILARLMLEPWHFKHEDVARALQQVADPATVDALYRAALHPPEYLSFDENASLGVKCAWALGRIGTPEALERLRKLAGSASAPLREAAEQQLGRA
jgi:HEAT repeat protein